MQNKLLLLSQIFLRVCLFDLFMRPSVSRQTVSFFGDTPILIEKVFFIELFTLLSLLNIPTSMPTWLFPFLALLVAVQLHLIARSANPVAAQLRHRWRATLFHPKATLRSSSRRGSHRNDSASNSTQYSNEYPNLALSSSSLKLQTML